MGKKLTLEEVKERLKNINPNIEILSEEYINSKTKLRCVCMIDGNEWYAQWNILSLGCGCPICGSKRAGEKKRIKIEEIERLNKNKTIEVLECEIREYGSTSKRTGTFVKYKCLIDGYEGWMPLSTFKAGGGCSACSGRSINETNSLGVLRPDLIKYFLNENDPYTVSISSSKKFQMKCPECGTLKATKLSASDLTRSSFSCDCCSDGISIPEKFVGNMLNQLNIDFEKQYSPKWADNKRYDFYIPSLNMIMEVHGIQHYEEIKRGRSLKEEQENDLLKYNLALENGFNKENYVVIDGRKSEFEWLKENCIKEMCCIVTLSKVNWDKVWLYCQSSIMIKVCNYWDGRDKNDTVLTVSKIFGVCRNTALKYLKRGTKIGLCNYNPKEETYKSGKQSKRHVKMVYQFDLNNNYIQSFLSHKEARSETGAGHVSCCCLGRYMTSGGFKWSYNPPVNGMYPD